MEILKINFNHGSYWKIISYLGLAVFFIGVGILSIYHAVMVKIISFWLGIGILDIFLGLLFYFHQLTLWNSRFSKKLFLKIFEKGILTKISILSFEKFWEWKEISRIIFKKDYIKIYFQNRKTMEIITTSIHPDQYFQLILNLKHYASEKGFEITEY